MKTLKTLFLCIFLLSCGGKSEPIVDQGGCLDPCGVDATLQPEISELDVQPDPVDQGLKPDLQEEIDVVLPSELVATDSAPPALDDSAEVEPEQDITEPTDTLKVLFIGNSYTYFNDLPQMVRDLFEEAGYPVLVDSITKGGAWLQNHYQDPATLESIQKKGWTHVVLQEQSTLPVIASGTFIFAAADLSQVIHGAGALPVFFETWARAEGNPLYQTDLSGYTPASMQEELRFRYQLAANNNNGLYAPVGDAWELSLEEHPDIALYSEDGSHPAVPGSFLAACVFYEVLTGLNVVNTSWTPDSMSEEDAATLRSVAHQMVNSL